MGYEMRFYIGTRHKATKGIDNPDYSYFKKIAMFDYCKDSDLADFIFQDDKYESAKVYGFFTQEDKEEIMDKYGDEFKEIPFEDMIKYLTEHPNYEYRRYLPFKIMLEGFNLVKSKFDNDIEELILIHYGY